MFCRRLRGNGIYAENCSRRLANLPCARVQCKRPAKRGCIVPGSGLACCIEVSSVTGSSFPREQPTVFRRGSNVLEYWLAHAEGFEVASRSVRPARVERVVVDPVRGHATGLIVRSFGVGRSRRRIVAADAVVAVDPFLRTLHLAHSPSGVASAGRASSVVARCGCRTDAPDRGAAPTGYVSWGSAQPVPGWRRA